MMNPGKELILPLALLMLELTAAGCAAGYVHSDRDDSVKISQYKTYQWLTQSDIHPLGLDDPPIDYVTGLVTIRRNPEVEPKIREIVERNL